MTGRREIAEYHPSLSPPYHRPPIEYVGTRVLNVLCRAQRPSLVNQWIPSCYRPSFNDGLFVLHFLQNDRVDSDPLSFPSTESGIVIPAETEDGRVTGSTYAVLYIDNDIGLTAGREIWGYPKKAGNVQLSWDGANSVTATTHHHEYRDGKGGLIFSAKVDLDGTADELLPLLASLVKVRLLRKVTPSPFGPGISLDEQVKILPGHGHVSYEKTGRATVEFGDCEEGFGEWGPVEVLGASFRIADFTLGYGHPIDA